MIALTALIGLVSCTKEDRLEGSWKLESMELSIGGVHSTVTAQEFGLDMVLNFKSNGTVTVSINGEISEETPYSVDGNKIIVEGESMEFSLSGKTLILNGSGMMDDIPGDATLKFVRL